MKRYRETAEKVVRAFVNQLIAAVTPMGAEENPLSGTSGGEEVPPSVGRAGVKPGFEGSRKLLRGLGKRERFGFCREKG